MFTGGETPESSGAAGKTRTVCDSMLFASGKPHPWLRDRVRRPGAMPGDAPQGEALEAKLGCAPHRVSSPAVMDLIRAISAHLSYAVILFCIAEALARGAVVWCHQTNRRFAGESSVAWRLNWSPGGTGYPSMDRYHPQLGWVPKPNLDSLTVAGRPVSTNSRGIRDLREFDYAKPAGKKRLLVFGDSFAFGEEVANEETFAFYLQEKLPDWEVMNFGVHGYGHDQMLVYLKEEGTRYQPDIVLLAYVNIDAGRNELTFRDYAKPYYRLEHGALALTNVPIPPPEEHIRQLRSSSRLIDLLELLVVSSRGQQVEAERRMWRRTAAILRSFSDTTRAAGARPMLVYLPFGEELNSPKPSGHEARFFALCKSTGSACHSLKPDFEASTRQGMSFDEAGHWEPKAHQVAAQAIYDALTNGAGAEALAP
jgi:hypothetical protein